MKRLIPITMILFISLILSHGSLSGRDDSLKKVQTWLKGLDETYTLKGLKNLKKLDLSRKQLKTLPPEIGNLKALKELYLGDNQLKTVPKVIGHLKALTRLDLRKNPLSGKEKAKIKKLLPKCEIVF